MLAASSVLWRGNGWFGVKFWTPMSAEISLERSLHQLFIDAKNNSVVFAGKRYDKKI
jgi:hypothetical protein